MGGSHGGELFGGEGGEGSDDRRICEGFGDCGVAGSAQGRDLAGVLNAGELVEQLDCAECDLAVFVLREVADVGEDGLVEQLACAVPQADVALVCGEVGFVAGVFEVVEAALAAGCIKQRGALNPCVG